jgi:D-beta-D-heptose 7-phosphate kinase/D-beta-D-heptose 1-phosphate adenosyltransferase
MKSRSIFPLLQNKRILVVGDIMLDRFLYGDVERISPEAPVPVLFFKEEKFAPGGAANVVMNLLGLNMRVALAGVIGDDEPGRKLTARLEGEKRLDQSAIIREIGRRTTEKIRIIGNHQQIARIDKEERKGVSERTFQELKNRILSQIKDVSAVIISDYGKGVVSKKLIAFILGLRKRFNFIVTVDPKVGHFFLYKGVDLITPNNKEASEASGIKILDSKSLKGAAQKIMQRLACRNLLITLGAEGMILFNQQNREGYHIPTQARQVYDVSGAGDTVISVMTAIMCTGVHAEQAARIANQAAGIVVGEFGTTAITLDKLVDSVKGKNVIC